MTVLWLTAVDQDVSLKKTAAKLKMLNDATFWQGFTKIAKDSCKSREKSREKNKSLSIRRVIFAKKRHLR